MLYFLCQIKKTYYWHIIFLYTGITFLYSDWEVRPFVCAQGNRGTLRAESAVHMLKDLVTGNNDQSTLHIPELWFMSEWENAIRPKGNQLQENEKGKEVKSDFSRATMQFPWPSIQT